MLPHATDKLSNNRLHVRDKFALIIIDKLVIIYAKNTSQIYQSTEYEKFGKNHSKYNELTIWIRY